MSLGFRSLKKNLLCSWPLRFPGAEKRLITCMQAEEIICLSLDLEFSVFYIFEFPRVLIPESIMLTGIGAGRTGPAEQATAHAKLPYFCLRDPSPKCSSRACPVSPCSVHALCWSTQEDWASFRFCGEECMRRYAPHELPGGQDMLTGELQGECLLWPNFAHTSGILNSHTLLLFMGCGP